MADTADLYTGRVVECVRCGEKKTHAAEHFRSCQERRTYGPYKYVKRVCRSCEHRARNEYHRTHRERINAQRALAGTYEKRRQSNLMKKYGLTVDSYNDLLARQSFRCAICGLLHEENRRGIRPEPLYVDHDHATGRIRGLLCSHCNRGIGLFQDNTGNLRKAVAYLERSVA